MSGVYAIVNAVTGRIYVGATEGPMKQRVERHYSLLRRGKHFIPDMQREWEQHGSDVYAWRALESVIGGPIALRQRDSHWLAEFAAKGASPDLPVVAHTATFARSFYVPHHNYASRLLDACAPYKQSL